MHKIVSAMPAGCRIFGLAIACGAVFCAPVLAAGSGDGLRAETGFVVAETSTTDKSGSPKSEWDAPAAQKPSDQSQEKSRSWKRNPANEDAPRDPDAPNAPNPPAGGDERHPGGVEHAPSNE